MADLHIRRSVLYVPASRAGALAKARTLPADVVVLDLEDAVAPEAKERAREAACAALQERGFRARELAVRVNAPGTPWSAADLAAVAQAAPDAVLLPKVAGPEDVVECGRALARAGAPPRVRLWAMIETAAAMLDAAAIGRAVREEPRLACLVLGLNDLARETGVRVVPGRLPMQPWLATAVLAARVSGLDVIDGVYTAFRDLEGFVSECRQARDFGFDGKSLIHPDQVAAANAAFTPDAAEVERARVIVAAFDRAASAGQGALAVDGQMVEPLHADIARRTLALAAAAGADRA